MDITLSEKSFLVSLLGQTLGDLRQEIHHTDSFTFRQGLKDQESLLRQLIEKFQSLQS